MTILLFWFSLLFTGLFLWLTLEGAFVLWGSVRLHLQGQQAPGQIVHIVSELYQANPHRVQPRAGYTSVAIAAFTTEAGQRIEAKLPAPWPGPRAWEAAPYQPGDLVQVRYLPDAPACIEDAGSSSQLLRGSVLLGIGLVFFLITARLSRSLFTGLGPAGPVLSVVSKALLLALAAGVFFFQHLPALYRYLPAVQADACYTQNGLLLRQRDDKPFSGRLHTRTENSLSVYTYRDGVLHGPDVVYTNGIVKETGRMTLEGLCQNGLQEGEWLYYYPETGQVMAEQTFRAGVLDGPARQYYSVGVRQLEIEMHYADGIPHGPYKTYYPNGQLQMEATLEYGSYTGEVKLYAEDGTPMESAWFPASSAEGEITITEVE